MRELLSASGSDAVSTPSDPELSDRQMWERYTSGADELVRLNMVTTLSGAAVGADGLSGSINTAADGVVFSLLRAWADVVLVGASTARAEGYADAAIDARWQPFRSGRPEPAVAVLTRSRHLPQQLAQAADAGRVTAFVVPVTDPLQTPHEVIRVLRGRGYRRILLEGGPRVAGAFLAADAIDELCLSMTPLINTPELTWLPTQDAHPVLRGASLTSLWAEDDTVIMRWRPARRPGNADGGISEGGNAESG